MLSPLKLLALRRVETLTPSLAAMPDRVSPDFTLYVPPELDPLELAVETDELDKLLDPESLMVCPGKISEDRERLLAFNTVERLTLFRAAIPESVSPSFTV